MVSASPKSGLEFSNNRLEKSRRPTLSFMCFQSPMSVRLRPESCQARAPGVRAHRPASFNIRGAFGVRTLSLWTHSREGPWHTSWHEHKSQRTKARHGLTTFLWPNTHTGFQRAWPLCVGLLSRKGKSLVGSTLPGSLLTSRLGLHNRPSVSSQSLLRPGCLLFSGCP